VLAEAASGKQLTMTMLAISEREVLPSRTDFQTWCLSARGINNERLLELERAELGPECDEYERLEEDFDAAFADARARGDVEDERNERAAFHVEWEATRTQRELQEDLEWESSDGPARAEQASAAEYERGAARIDHEIAAARAAQRWDLKKGDRILFTNGEWTHVPATPSAEGDHLARFDDYTDMGLTRCLLEANPGLVWVPDMATWKIFDGARYAEAAESEVTALFDPFVTFLEASIPPRPEGADDEDDGKKDPHKTQRKFLNRIKSSARGAALQVTKSRSQRRSDRFDQNDRELVFSDVRLDLETGKTTPNAPDSFVTKALPWAYAPASATARDAWQAFLTKTGLAPDVLEFIQRGFGAAATGLCSEKAFFYFFGQSGTMKTTFAELVARTLDCYSARCDSKIFMTRRKDTGGHTDDLMSLPAARLVHCDETRETDRLDSAQIKRMTSGHGRSTLRLSAKGEKGRDVTIKFLVVFTSEHLARVDCDDRGLHARQKIVKFERVLSESERDPRFVERHFDLLRPAIVEWLIAGARAWLAGGLGVEPESVRQAGDENRKNQDWLLQIVDSIFELTDSDADRMSYEQIEAKIQAYLSARKRRETFTANKLGRVLSSAGFERDPDTKARKRIRARTVN
jgi:P4 family phage/plasmid primase-like protien